MNTNDSSAELPKENNDQEKIENKQSKNVVPIVPIVLKITFVETIILIMWGFLAGFSIYIVLFIPFIFFWSFVGSIVGAVIGRLGPGTRGSVIFFAILFSLLALGLGYSILWFKGIGAVL
jgi:uncharacterized membrane protein